MAFFQPAPCAHSHHPTAPELLPGTLRLANAVAPAASFAQWVPPSAGPVARSIWWPQHVMLATPTHQLLCVCIASFEFAFESASKSQGHMSSSGPVHIFCLVLQCLPGCCPQLLWAVGTVPEADQAGRKLQLSARLSRHAEVVQQLHLALLMAAAIMLIHPVCSVPAYGRPPGGDQSRGVPWLGFMSSVNHAYL